MSSSTTTSEEAERVVFDVCVVGAGVIGSATARNLAKQGHNTLLIEQFPLPHWRGSSHGQSRVFRTRYEDQQFVKMAKDSGKLWEEIELQAEEEFFIRNKDLLTVEEPPGTTQQRITTLLHKMGVAFEEVSSAALRSRYPQLRFPDGYRGLINKDAGVLKADKCLRCLQSQFVNFGGVLRDGEKVESLEPDSSGVTVRTQDKTYRSRKLILTAGPWTNKLLKPLGIQLPLRVIRAPVLYWTITKPGAYTSKQGFPLAFKDNSPSDGRYIFAVGSEEYPGLLKLGTTGDAQTGRDIPEVDPDRRDSAHERLERLIQMCSDYIREHFPYVDHRDAAIVEMSLYTMTPDRKFILDNLPNISNIIIGAGFSAHGFKHAPVVGEILTALVDGNECSLPYDLKPFKMSRFDTKTLKSLL